MTRQKLAIQLSKAYLGLSRKRALEIIDHLISNILVSVKENEPVTIPRLGVFIKKRGLGRKAIFYKKY